MFGTVARGIAFKPGHVEQFIEGDGQVRGRPSAGLGISHSLCEQGTSKRTLDERGCSKTSRVQESPTAQRWTAMYRQIAGATSRASRSGTDGNVIHEAMRGNSGEEELPVSRR